MGFLKNFGRSICSRATDADMQPIGHNCTCVPSRILTAQIRRVFCCNGRSVERPEIIVILSNGTNAGIHHFLTRTGDGVNHYLLFFIEIQKVTATLIFVKFMCFEVNVVHKER